MRTVSRFEATSLVLFRTLVGWHFLYEGYYKLLRPAGRMPARRLPDGARPVI